MRSKNKNNVAFIWDIYAAILFGVNQFFLFVKNKGIDKCSKILFQPHKGKQLISGIKYLEKLVKWEKLSV